MIDESRLIRKVGRYHIAQRGGGVTDRVLMDVANRYQMSVSEKFVTANAAELARRYPGEEEILVTTKYDGEGVFVYFEAGRQPWEAFCFNSPSGRCRVGFPALEQLGEHLKKQGVKKALLRGELYLPGKVEGKRIGVHEVLRISHSTNAAEIAQLSLAFFDLVMLDGKDMRSPEDFRPTWKKLHELLGTDGAFHAAAGVIVPEKEVERLFQAAVAEGQEGIVVRRLGRLELTKVKPDRSVDAAIIGYVEGEFEGNYGVLSVLTALNYPEKHEGNGCWQVMARVGSGLSDDLRQSLLTKLKPMRVEAPLAMTDSDGRTVHFVRPEFIVEVAADDFVTTNKEEKENQTQLLSWNGERWKLLNLAAFPRPLFPIFNRLREDKSISSGGARIAQVLPQASAPPIAKPRTDTPTKVVRREVYRKESKGEIMVRKLLVLETGGEDAFSFVVYWTDFSPKRKEPLKVSTAVADSPERAEKLAANFLAEGLAKGWEKVG